MNDLNMENLLRQAPLPAAPADLRENIISAIRLPAAIPRDIDWVAPQPWIRRWLPALSFATLLLTCLVAIGVQSNLIVKKEKANELLRAQAQDLDSLQSVNAEAQRLRNENARLEGLQRDHAELQRLRTEVAQLQSHAANLAALRAENQSLQSAAAAAAAPADTNDFFAETQDRAERIHCVNNLKQVGLAIRIFCGDYEGLCPTNLIAMTNELSTWMILQCPSDHARTVGSWADVTAGNVSYLYLGAGCKQSDDPRIIVSECPIHHNVGLLDGSVQQLSPEAYASRIQTIDGHRVLVDQP